VLERVGHEFGQHEVGGRLQVGLQRLAGDGYGDTRAQLPRGRPYRFAQAQTVEPSGPEPGAQAHQVKLGVREQVLRGGELRIEVSRGVTFRQRPELCHERGEFAATDPADNSLDAPAFGVHCRGKTAGGF